MSKFGDLQKEKKGFHNQKSPLFWSKRWQVLHNFSSQIPLEGGCFSFLEQNRPQKHKKRAILHTFQANGVLQPPPSLSYVTVRNSEIRKSFNIQPLLLRIKKSQLGWFGHVSKMPQETLSKQALLAKANGRRSVRRLRTRWTNYYKDLGWNYLGLQPSEMMDVMKDRKVWRLNLQLLPPQPSRKSGQWRKKYVSKNRKIEKLPDVSATSNIQVKFILPNAKSTQEGISEKPMRSSKSTALTAIFNINKRKLKLGNKY